MPSGPETPIKHQWLATKMLNTHHFAASGASIVTSTDKRHRAELREETSKLVGHMSKHRIKVAIVL